MALRRANCYVFAIDSPDREIPGYAFNPDSGRYFRKIPPFNGIEEDRILTIQPKDESVKNVPNLLMQRELGYKSGGHFERKLPRMKTLNFKKSEEIDFGDYIADFEEVIFLKSGPRSLIIEFKINKGYSQFVRGSAVTEIPHRYTPEWMINDPFMKYTVNEYTSLSDMCMGFANSECIMFVGNSLRNKTGVTQTMWRPQAMNGADRVLRHFTCICPIWCCSSNSFTEKFALGIQDAFSINGPSGNLYSREIKGNVHGITFDEKGNIVYCALHNGSIVINDLRTRKPVITKRVDRIGLDEVVLVDEDKYLICGGFDGLLCKVDLRTKRKILEYKGHAHTPWKTPFSVSNQHDILCATGNDNVTRFWSLSEGGDPLNYILPERENVLCRSCFITDGSRLSVCVSQKQKAMVYDIYT